MLKRVLIAGTAAVVLFLGAWWWAVDASDRGSDAELRRVLDAVPIPDGGWATINEAGRCTTTSDTSEPIPPYLVADADDGSLDYVDAGAAALRAEGFEVRSAGAGRGVVGTRGEGSAQLTVQLSSGPGRNPYGHPLPATTLLKVTRAPAWCDE